MTRKDIATVFIIEDNHAVVDSLQTILESVHLDVEVFNNASDYLKQYNPNRYGCLLVDIRLSGMSGLELLEELQKRNNPIPVIIMTAYGDVPMAVRALKLGAYHFIEKPFHPQTLLDTIHQAIELCYERHEHPAALLQPYVQSFHQLTPREKEVLKMLADGKLNKQIANELGMALSTVALYRSRILKKMKIKNIVALVRIYSLIEGQKLLEGKEQAA